MPPRHTNMRSAQVFSADTAPIMLEYFFALGETRF